MAKKKILTENNKEILPITHEKCVLDNNGVSLAEKIGNMDDLMADSDDLVSAINEVTSFNNNFKGLIADSIGSPISADDSFNDMRNDINSLLNQFKTNMMNAGVVVESGDKFESLIEKIKGLTEGEGNKGIHYASGTVGNIPSDKSITVNMNLDFEPTVIFCHFPEVRFFTGPYNYYYNVCMSSLYPILRDGLSDQNRITMTDITNSSFVLNAISPDANYTVSTVGTTTWYAIGVGEEDTTLRDSLADILENKGVDVTEEDDMADLITKVDSISSGGLDIISATELPATGNNMQLCAITNNITDSFILSNDEADVIISNDNTIGLHLSDLTMYEKYSYPIGGTLINLRIASAHQNASAIPLWLYYNNAWKQICFNSLFIIRDMLLQNGFTISHTSSSGNYKSSKGISILPGDQSKLIGYTPFKEPVDFSKYRAIRIKGTYKNTTESSGTFGPGIGIFGRTSNISNGTNTGVGFGLTDIGNVFETKFARSTDFTTNVTTSTPFDITFNVSDINTQYYLGIATAFTKYTYITDIELIMN